MKTIHTHGRVAGRLASYMLPEAYGQLLSFKANMWRLSVLVLVYAVDDCTLLQVSKENTTLNRLDYPQELLQDHRVVSANGKFAIVMQSDGNLVEQYRRGDGTFWGGGCWHANKGNHFDRPWTLSWASGDPQAPGGPGSYMVIRDDRWSIHQSLPETTPGVPQVKTDQLIVQDDGNLVWKYKGAIVYATCGGAGWGGHCCK